MRIKIPPQPTASSPLALLRQKQGDGRFSIKREGSTFVLDLVFDNVGMEFGPDEFMRCGYCWTVFFFRPIEKHTPPDCPMCGRSHGRLADSEEITRAWLAESLRESDGKVITGNLSDTLARANLEEQLPL